MIIDPADLTLVHTLHVNGSGPEPRPGLFFATDTWIGAPSNREPQKCSGLGWYDLHALPTDLLNYSAAGITAYRRGTQFSIMGWTG